MLPVYSADVRAGVGLLQLPLRTLPEELGCAHPKPHVGLAPSRACEGAACAGECERSELSEIERVRGAIV